MYHVQLLFNNGDSKQFSDVEDLMHTDKLYLIVRRENKVMDFYKHEDVKYIEFMKLEEK